jgi:protoheme IX farnesyltransferase
LELFYVFLHDQHLVRHRRRDSLDHGELELQHDGNVIRAYSMLTKPGIILGNLITTAGGFAFASQEHFSGRLFFLTLIGLGLTIASACVFNNYMDRHADAKMARTRQRAFVQGTVSVPLALSLALLMGLLGVFLLGTYANWLAAFLGAFGFFFYVGMYTALKHRSTSGTLIGSISGAIPPVVGYAAVRDQIDLGALLLFVILFFWQMPHFYAIAIYRLKEYQAANIPVLPAKRGIFRTKVAIAIYIALFTLAASLLAVFGFKGAFYLILMLVFSLGWLALSLQGFRTKNDTKWARSLFQYSLLVILAFSSLISVSL